MSLPAHVVGTDLAGCSEMQCGNPLHPKVTALRLQGKRWSEIGAAMGVDAITIWRWRAECPHIDDEIGREAADYLESTKHALVRLLPDATKALGEIINDKTHSQRHAAVKTALEMFTRQGPGDLTPAGMLKQLRAAEQLSDAELDAQLAAAIDATPKRK